MDPKDDEEISIDFSKVKKFFKSDEKEEKKESEGKEEEISIDFSKVKSFFKSDKSAGTKTEHTHKDEHERKKDDEIEFDVSKIKKFFKSGEQERHSDEDINVNWGKLFDFLKKYGLVFLALIPVILSIYIRMQAGFLPFADDWATSSVINNIRSQIKSGIDQQYPNLPDANKNALADTEFQKIVSQNKQQIDQQIKGTSDYIKAFFQDESGKNYMPDIDPYYWSRYAKNIVENGHPGDILKDGKPFDNRQLAPLGRFVYPDMFHSYSWAYFYKFLHFFVPNLELMRSGFYLTIFVSALCVLLVFLIARKIAGDIGGLFAALMMAVNGAFLSRSLHPDNDIWVIFFPLLITWLFVATIDAKSILKITALTLLAGFFTGLFTYAWSGWWYIFDFLLATVGITFLYLILANLHEAKRGINAFFRNLTLRNLIIIGLVYFFSTALFVIFFSGWPGFRNSFLGPLSFPSIKAPVQSTTLWPNVLTTVAELNEGSINGIINSIGGPFLFYISLLGIVLSMSRKDGIKRFDFMFIMGAAVYYAVLFMKFGNNPAVYQSVSIFSLLALIMLPILAMIAFSIYKKDPSYDFKLPILLALWIISTIFASIKGIRFTLLLAPAFSVAFGVALGKIYAYSSRLMAKELKIHKSIGSSILIILLLLAYVNPIRGAIAAANSDIPIVNDAWYNALNAIKQDSSESAIITSWWDFGHHFKAITERRVTFDGTTQTSPAAHWVGKLLMTDDEAEAAGILRMLDCGHNTAYEEIYRITNDAQLSLKILDGIIVLSGKEAEKKLKGIKFNNEQVEKILSLTHCSPPEAYFIASEDMIGKSGVWSHFGSWSFERADIWQNARKMPQEESVDYMVKKFNYTKEKAENVYYEIQSIRSDSEANTWISPWPGYGGTVSCTKNDNSIYVCGNGLQVNLSSYDVFGAGQQGIVRPKVVVFTIDSGMLKKEFDGATLDFGLTIIPQGENDMLGVLSSKELAGGMFTRMFYMKGHGLRYFKLFDHQRGLTGTDIYTYKIDWEGKNATIVDDYLKKPVKEENTTESIDAAPANTSNATINNANIS